ncbi:hypothetical protein MC885_016160, partial [Smutsia gigantea]
FSTSPAPSTGPGSCSSFGGLQRGLPRRRWPLATERASCEVRWEEAAWEPPRVDAGENTGSRARRFFEV